MFFSLLFPSHQCLPLFLLVNHRTTYFILGMIPLIKDLRKLAIHVDYILSLKYTFPIHYSFIFCFIGHCHTKPRVFPNSFCSWRYPWTPDPLVSACLFLVLDPRCAEAHPSGPLVCPTDPELHGFPLLAVGSSCFASVFPKHYKQMNSSD